MATEKGRVALIGLTLLNEVEPEADRFTIWDNKLKGFGLRVSPSGTKTYIVRYRLDGGRSGTLRQIKIGGADKLTPDEARKLARTALASAVKGEDPQGERLAKRAEMTVSQLCDEYLAHGVEHKKASTLVIDRGRIANHIKPILGALKLSEVTKGKVEELKAAVGNGRFKDKTVRTKGGKPAANRTLGLLSSIFSFAIDRQLMKDNPCRGVKLYTATKRERFLSTGEMNKLGETLAELEAAGWPKEPVTILRLLLLTGCRRSEISALQWSEVDAARGLLQLIDSKTGPKAVPVGAPVLKILADVTRTDSRYVFPDPRDPDKPYHALDHDWRKIRAIAGFPTLRMHDLRHSYASIGLAGGMGLALIGKLLGHANIATTQRYAHLADDPVRAAADSIASAIDGAMKGAEAEVVPLKGVK